jgi:hypothetical protein
MASNSLALLVSSNVVCSLSRLNVICPRKTIPLSRKSVLSTTCPARSATATGCWTRKKGTYVASAFAVFVVLSGIEMLTSESLIPI